MNPKVSVIMSVYNGEKFLRDSIESILNQTFNDFEFIIIDDCSTDKTADIIKTYSYRDPRIRIITNEQNLGLTKSLNIGINESRGEFIARMDSDDVTLPERFEKQVRFLDENKDYGVVGAWAKVIDDLGVEVDEFDWETDDKTIRKNLIKWNSMIHPLAMIRKDILEKVGMYSENLRYAQDYDLWFRVAKVSKLANLPEFLLKYRISNKSITASKNKEQSLCALKARWCAIKSGLYSPIYIVYLARPILGMILPKKLKDFYK